MTDVYILIYKSSHLSYMMSYVKPTSRLQHLQEQGAVLPHVVDELPRATFVFSIDGEFSFVISIRIYQDVMLL